MNLANQITILRVILIPVFIVVFYLPYGWSYPVSAAIFAFAGITDWLDGYIARKYDQSTPFGAFLDPVADKLMVAVALVLLVEVHASPWFAIPAAVIICREILVSALREWMAEIGQRSNVAVSYIGKVKTVLQIISIIVLLAFNKDFHVYFTYLGYILLYVAAILTLWSMFIYLRAAWPSLKPKAGEVEKDDSGIEP